MSGHRRKVLVDASVFITLAETGSAGLIHHRCGYIEMPAAVKEEISDGAAASILNSREPPWINERDVRESLAREDDDSIQKASSHLGVENPAANWYGDVALLAYALALREHGEDVVVVTDDKPLRKTCKTLSIPVSGSIGVLIRAVERGDISSDEAKDRLYAMDEVGARLSASLVNRAERLIDDAAEEPN